MEVVDGVKVFVDPLVDGVVDRVVGLPPLHEVNNKLATANTVAARFIRFPSIDVHHQDPITLARPGVGIRGGGACRVTGE